MVKKDFAFMTYCLNTLDIDFAVLLEARSPRSYYGLGLVKKDLAFLTFGYNTSDMDSAVLLEARSPRSYYAWLG